MNHLINSVVLDPVGAELATSTNTQKRIEINF